MLKETKIFRSSARCVADITGSNTFNVVTYYYYYYRIMNLPAPSVCVQRLDLDSRYNETSSNIPEIEEYQLELGTLHNFAFLFYNLLF